MSPKSTTFFVLVLWERTQESFLLSRNLLKFLIQILLFFLIKGYLGLQTILLILSIFNYLAESIWILIQSEILEIRVIIWFLLHFRIRFSFFNFLTTIFKRLFLFLNLLKFILELSNLVTVYPAAFIFVIILKRGILTQTSFFVSDIISSQLPILFIKNL